MSGLNDPMQLAERTIALEVVTGVLEPKPKDSAELTAAKAELQNAILKTATLTEEIQTAKLQFTLDSGLFKLEAMYQQRLDILKLQANVNKTEALTA